MRLGLSIMRVLGHEGRGRPTFWSDIVSFDAGWSSLVARRAHNPEVAGSNPAPATRETPVLFYKELGFSFSTWS